MIKKLKEGNSELEEILKIYESVKQISSSSSNALENADSILNFHNQLSRHATGGRYVLSEFASKRESEMQDSKRLLKTQKSTLSSELAKG